MAQKPEAVDAHEALKQQLIEVDDAELVAAIGKARKRITEAKSEHGKSGRAVQAENEKLELIMIEIEKREQRREDAKQLELSGGKQ